MAAAPRRTILIHNALLDTHNSNSLHPVSFFEFGLSHDGKALAVSSAGLALSAPKMLPEDCALFIVDLAHPAHKVTKIPIPLPAKHVMFKD